MMKFRSFIAMFSAAGLAGLMACSNNQAADNSGTMGTESTEATQEKDPGEMLSVGEKAPNFVAKDELGQQYQLSELIKEKNVVLMIYPADNTPGCTAQLCAARDDWSMYQDANVQVFGLNPGSADSHAAFSSKYNFPFPLLVDEDGEIISEYGAKGLMGFPKRTVYGINQEGVVVFAERGSPGSEEILSAFEG